MSKYKIHTYCISRVGQSKLVLPIGSKVLTIEGEEGRVWIHVALSNNAKLETRLFECFNITDELDSIKGFIGTVDIGRNYKLIYVFDRGIIKV
jgi:hypothetical protein